MTIDAVRRLDHPDYERHTVIVDALPHASTIGRLEDWREAAAAFLRRIHADGYDVVKLPDPPGRLRWWRYAVLRGDGIPAELDGRWYDLNDLLDLPAFDGAVLDATNRWEQRDDGTVAVVYEWIRHG